MNEKIETKRLHKIKCTKCFVGMGLSFKIKAFFIIVLVKIGVS